MSGIILDIDMADKGLCALLERHYPMSGLWGYKIGDKILTYGLTTALCPIGKKYNIFADLKHHDVRGRLTRIVKLYAELSEYAPKFLTISGARPVEAIASAVEARGSINIILRRGIRFRGTLGDD